MGQKVFYHDLTVYGSLNYTGDSKRIKADFSNATPSLRTAYQTETTNGNTYVSVIPNGSGTIAASQWWGSSSMANTHYGEVRIDANGFYFNSAKAGSGTAKSAIVQIDGVSKVTVAAGSVSTASPVLVNGAALSTGLNASLETTTYGIINLGTLVSNLAYYDNGGGYNWRSPNTSTVAGYTLGGGANDVAMYGSPPNAGAAGAVVTPSLMWQWRHNNTGWTFPDAVAIGGSVAPPDKLSVKGAAISLRAISTESETLTYKFWHRPNADVACKVSITSVGEGSWGTGDMRFNTSNALDGNPAVERMRITSGGNVNIGYGTDTGYKFSVNGSTHVLNNRVQGAYSAQKVNPGTLPWYRLGSTPGANTAQRYRLVVFALRALGGGHHAFEVEITKATTQNSDVGSRVNVRHLGSYGYPTYGLNLRVVDAGVNAATHLDIQFKTTETYDVYVAHWSDCPTGAHWWLPDTSMTSQGTGAAGTVLDAGAAEQRWDYINGITYTRDISGNEVSYKTFEAAYNQRHHPRYNKAFTPASTSEWYRIGQLGQTTNLGHAVRLMICCHQPGYTHQLFEIFLGKTSSGSGAGVVCHARHMGGYAVTSGGVVEARVVDGGVSSPTYIDLRFRVAASLEMYVSAVSDTVSGNVWTPADFVAQGTGAAGTGWDPNLAEWNWDNSNGVRRALGSDGRMTLGSAQLGQKMDVVSGGLRAQGNGAPSGGAGAEVDYLSGTARFYGYDRQNSLWLPCFVGGSTVGLAINNVNQLAMHSDKAICLWNSTEKGWESSGTYRMRAVQLSQATAIASRFNNSDNTAVSLYALTNAYFDGTNWKRVNATDVCGNLQLTNILNLRRAASGTADSTITWTTSFITDTSDNLTVTGNVTAYSDRRAKENVSTIQSALEKVRALTGVTYNRKDVEGKPRQMGLIAQDVQSVAPEVVIYDEENDRYSLAYGNLVALLIEAVKEQDEKIARLERMVTTCKATR